MKIDILCTDPNHPVHGWIEKWFENNQLIHDIKRLNDKGQLRGGDVLFLVSCGQVIAADLRALYSNVMVLHASDLPKGRGWNPHIWAILDGAKTITVTLLEAEDSIDTGAIWAQKEFSVQRSALFDEVNEALFEAELSLMSEGIELIQSGFQPKPQRDESATYYPKRTPANSEVDPTVPLVELFNEIRIADPERYPAFFRAFGETYTVELKKVTKDE